MWKHTDIIIILFQNGRCKYQPSSSGSNCTGYVDLPNGNELKLQAAVATIGPISVGIDASHASFMNYKGGKCFFTKCLKKNLYT